MGCTVRRLNPAGSKIFHTCPDWPWGPPSLLYNGYRRQNSRGVALTTHLPPIAEIKEGVGAIPLPLPIFFYPVTCIELWSNYKTFCCIVIIIRINKTLIARGKILTVVPMWRFLLGEPQDRQWSLKFDFIPCLELFKFISHHCKLFLWCNFVFQFDAQFLY